MRKKIKVKRAEKLNLREISPTKKKIRRRIGAKETQKEAALLKRLWLQSMPNR